jgi:hypothetical protein
MANGEENNKKPEFLSDKDLRNIRAASEYQERLLETYEYQKIIQKEIRGLQSDIANTIQSEVSFSEQKNEKLRTTEELQSAQIKNANLLKKIQFEIKEAEKKGDTRLANSLKIQKTSLDNNKKDLKDQMGKRDLIADQMGLIDNIAEGIKNIPGVGKALKNTLDMVVAGQEKSILKGEKGIKRIGALFTSLKPAIKELMGAGAFLVLGKALLAADKALSDFQKNLGISAQEAGNLRLQLGAASTSLAVTSADTMKTFTDINAQLGLATTAIRSDIIAEMSKLGKLTNMSAESQASFAMFAQKSGMHAEKLTDEARNAVVAAESERGVRLDINKILDEAGKITGVIRANLGFNIIAISEAVAAAKQFGLTLQDLEGISANLLNFQQSIEAELQAELFTGKQLNLERARLAALTADYKTLAKEITSQAGGELEFARLNVLEKQKLAAALGMSVDRMSDLVFQNANLQELAEQARQAGDDELAAMLERRSVQESFMDIVQQLKVLFVEMMTPLLPAMEAFANMLQNSEKLKETLKGITQLGFGLLVGGLVKAALAMVIGSSAALGPIGFVAGMAAAMKISSMINEAANATTKNLPEYRNLPPGQTAMIKSGAAIGHAGENITHTRDLESMMSKTNTLTKQQGEEIINLLAERQHIQYDKFSAYAAPTKFG